MNLTTKLLALFVFLEITKASSTERSSTTKLNNSLISLNKRTTLYNNITVSNTRNKKISLLSSTKTTFKQNKKWKIGRVTNKQFGIVNILWQKTKVFIDQDYSDLTCRATTIEMTPDIQNQITSGKGASKFSIHQGKLQTSTPSYIEFYYLDQADDRIKRKNPSNTKLQKLNKGNKTNTNRSSGKKSSFTSLLEISINALRRKHTPQPTKLVLKVGQGNIYGNKLNKSKQTTLTSKAPVTVRTKTKTRSSKQPQQPKELRSELTTNIFTKKTPGNSKMRQDSKVSQSKNKSYYSTIFFNDTNYVIKSYLVSTITSTACDKVKFFEIYDNNTPKLQNYILGNLRNNITFNNKDIDDRDDKRILLHHVNENIGHHQNKNKTRYVKKHIQDLYNKEVITRYENNISDPFSTRHDLKVLTDTYKFQIPFERNFSRRTSWTEFPFVAVYLYEPSQVRCDVASISPHWLVGAATCLSRHRRGFRGGGLSAYVTFCGDDWRKPQVISYVKRTIIHPMYHPEDDIRRLFNAGLIQVVNSMADTCIGWQPASLMSHQYTADDKCSIGTAVGWGLDRYDESSAINTPNHALMAYEGRVYSQMCPGSTEYSEAKNYDEVGVKNVYCLLLPPYLAEENDTVHGALLLIGGKLLALYLKEERRPWGVQSAKYTGIWRLLPWLTETAREPDDSFQFEI